MSATSLPGAIGAMAAALLTLHLLRRRTTAAPPLRRFATLDGLRGYAAFLVYVHHSAIWYAFARTGEWAPPASRLFTHFGQSSVAIFFMITGFLFWTKLIDGRTRPIDWRRLFVSRLLRLVPLFLVFVALLWAVALAASGMRLRVSAPRAVLDTLQWLTFTVAGMPDINDAPTASVIGGAAWSLPYEWWFYLSLPLAALLVGRRPPRAWLILGLGCVGGIWWVSSHGGWHIAAAFLGGIAAAFLVRQPWMCTAARHPIASIACVGALAAATRFPTGFAPAPLLLLSLAFAAIACGNTMFGVLEWPAARGLGDAAYSIYLLHGIVLFAVFGMLLGPDGTAALGAPAYWLVVCVCAALVTVASHLTFRLIEAPAMASVDRVTARLAL